MEAHCDTALSLMSLRLNKLICCKQLLNRYQECIKLKLTVHLYLLDQSRPGPQQYSGTPGFWSPSHQSRLPRPATA